VSGSGAPPPKQPARCQGRSSFSLQLSITSAYPPTFRFPSPTTPSQPSPPASSTVPLSSATVVQLQLTGFASPLILSSALAEQSLSLSRCVVAARRSDCCLPSFVLSTFISVATVNLLASGLPRHFDLLPPHRSHRSSSFSAVLGCPF
jgi:hypothetical protein